MYTIYIREIIGGETFYWFLASDGTFENSWRMAKHFPEDEAHRIVDDMRYNGCKSVMLSKDR